MPRCELRELYRTLYPQQNHAHPNYAMSDAPPSEPRDAPKGAVVVVGSANVDLVMNPRDLLPGVTVLAPSYKLLPGGKGANQAYACAKLGCESVRFIGATGDDDFAKLVLGNSRPRAWT